MSPTGVFGKADIEAYGEAIEAYGEAIGRVDRVERVSAVLAHDKRARAILIKALVERRSVIVVSDKDGRACALAGRVVKVGPTHAVVDIGSEDNSGVPIAAITSIDVDGELDVLRPAVST